VTLIAGISRTSFAQNLNAGDQPTASVRVDNLAAVPVETLRFAEACAAEVFSRIGARVRWIDEEAAVRGHLAAQYTLVLVNAKHDPGIPGIQDSLGVAAPQLRRAYVFYDRIDALRVRQPANVAIILGAVIAHELGHLMLASLRHSGNGIMSPSATIRAQPLDTFTAPQAREILSRLRQAPWDTEHR
jgi:predicted Zn-dependent protease